MTIHFGRFRALARMAGVVGRDERPLASSVHQSPALIGLLVMVELAQPLEQVQHGDVDLGPIDPVVGLEVGGARPAPFSGAGGEQPVKCGLLGGGGAPAQVGHADNVFSFGHHRFQDGVPTVRLRRLPPGC